MARQVDRTRACWPIGWAGTVGLVCLIAALAFGGCSESPAGDQHSDDPAPQRLILITLDTLRYDALNGEGGRAPSMPKLASRLETSGARFDRFFSASSRTQPSHASMFTGLHPWEHGVVRNGLVLDDSHETVAERLRAAGFATAAAVASFPVSARFGYAQGFDHFLDDFDRGGDEREWNDVRVGEQRFYSLAPSVTTRALALLDALDQAGSSRQHLWVHYFDPHAPYGDANAAGPVLPLPRLLRMLERPEGLTPADLAEARRLYDRDATSLDAQIERLLQRLERDAGRFETHVVLASDHGESFGEHGSLGHGYRLTPEQVRVPLAIFSSAVEAGVRRDPCGSVDVATTLLALAGLPTNGLDGRNLGAATPTPTDSQALGLRDYDPEPGSERRLDGPVPVTGHRFYLADGRHGLRVGGIAAPDEVYTLGEANAEAPDAEAQARWRERFEQVASRVEAHGSPGALDAETLEGLRALGYAP